MRDDRPANRARSLMDRFIFWHCALVHFDRCLTLTMRATNLAVNALLLLSLGSTIRTQMKNLQKSPRAAAEAHIAPEQGNLPRTPHLTWLLFAIVFVGAILRFYWARTQHSVIEYEGAEYASIARNLVGGLGYVGSLEGGTQLIFPPMYPLSIAGLSLVTGSVEFAARLVSVIFGAMLAIPMFFITRYLYNLRSALLAAAITALHPLFIRLSASTYSEALFSTLSMTGVYWGLRTVTLERKRDPILAGASFGLAYLTRPEGVLYVAALVFATLLVAVLDHRQIKRTAIFCVLLATSFVVFILPYVAFLSIELGEFRIEGKGSLNLLIAERMNSGMSFSEASYGLGDESHQDGPALDMNGFVREPSHLQFGVGDLIAHVTMATRRNLRPLYDTVFSSANGFPLLLVLTTVAFFHQPWSQRRLLMEATVLSFIAFHSIVLLVMHALFTRYVFPLLPFLILWNAHGIDRLTIWLRRTIRNSCSWRVLRSRAMDWGFIVITTVVLLVICARGTAHINEFRITDATLATVKEAGVWLGDYMPGPKTIMDTEAVVPYYSNGTLLCLPYAESSIAVRYLEKREPDFVVLKSYQREWRPFIELWMADGIPSPRAELIYESDNALEEKVLIYRWHSSEADPRF